MAININLISTRLRCEIIPMKIEFFSIFSAWLFPIILPIVHIWTLWYFWSKYHFKVDKSLCTCECWDLVFKGPYENGVGSYKNFYFNATQDSMEIWMIVATGIMIFYECMKYLTKLMLRGKLRFSMLVLFLSSIFPHYYSWWTYINYLNDSFYEQWNHQLFFTITEMLSTSIVLYLMNIHRELTQIKLLAIVGISIMHVIASGVDQFVANIILMQGSPHQIIRDIGFLVPDILHIIIPLIELDALRKYELFPKKWYQDKYMCVLLIIMSGCIAVGCCVVAQL